MQTIKSMMGFNKVSGDLGVEIELEAREKMPYSGLPGGWRAEQDGSLRGHSAEYVMSKPVPYSEVSHMLNSLKECLDSSRCRPKFSERAGVHVHVNVHDLTLEEVIRFALVYYTLEDTLVRFCGEGRVGNHFCLRIRDAQYPLTLLEGLEYEEQVYSLQTEHLRYASLNFLSLFRYGSIEFRAMESQPDLSKIDDWCQILLRIRDYAVGLSSRSSIAYDVSFHGPEGFLQNIVGERLFSVLNHNNLEEETMQSLRLAQLAIYKNEVTT